MTSLLLTMSSAYASASSEELISVEQYNTQREQAFELFSQSKYEQALPAIEVMAQMGDKKAQYVAGIMYLNAQGTEQDLLKSYAWLSVATEQKTSQWARPLEMLDSKLPADYLAVAKQEAEKFVALYGAKAQQLKCRNVRTLGSKQPTHECTKSEIKDGYYFAANPTYIVAN